MRTLAIVLVLGCVAVGTFGAVRGVSAQEPGIEVEDARTALETAGVPLLNSPASQPIPPAEPGPAAAPRAIPVDLPIPDPTDWNPNPTDWIPGGLNPLNWAGTS